MKGIAVSILILLMLTQTFSKWVILLEYNINKEYIAKALCENRSPPMLHCNGKCQVMKKIAAEEAESNKENDGRAASKLMQSEVVFLASLISFQLPDVLDSKKIDYPIYTLTVYPAPVFTIFHPPLVC